MTTMQSTLSRVLHLFQLCVSAVASARFVGLSLQSLLVTSIRLFHCRLLFICPQSLLQRQRYGSLSVIRMYAAYNVHSNVAKCDISRHVPVPAAVCVYRTPQVVAGCTSNSHEGHRYLSRRYQTVLKSGRAELPNSIRRQTAIPLTDWRMSTSTTC